MDKKYSLLTAGSVGLIVAASAAMAAAPGGGGFGQFTSDSAGNVSGCISGATCSTLVTGNGFLQQQVTVTSGIGAGTSYYRTIILDANTAVTGFGGTFADESFVDTANNGGGNMADQNYVGFTSANEAGSGQTGTATMAGVTIPTNSVTSILARGTLAAGTDTAANLLDGSADARGIKIVQNNDFNVDMSTGGSTTSAGASGNRSVNFLYMSDDAGDPNQAAGTNFYMRLDEFSNATAEGPMTVRESSGIFTAANDNGAGVGVLQLPDGQTLNYSAGDDIKVSWLNTNALGGPSHFGPGTTGFGYDATGQTGFNNGAVVQAQSFTNKSTGESIAMVNDTHALAPTNAAVIAGNLEPGDNTGTGALTGYPYTSFTPQNTTSTLQPWNAANWDPNFGSAPVGYAGRTAPGSAAVAFPQ